MRRSFALVFFLLACGSDEAAPTDTASPTDAVVTADGEATDTGSTDTTPIVERGPKRIALDADPNGLWWDAASATLYIADDNGNRILSWSDATGATALVAELPSPSPEGPGLGQVIKLADGRLIVTRFGYGSTGDVVVVDAAGTATVAQGLDASRRRIGLAVAPDGTLYTSWFTKTGQNPRVGAVGRLELGPPVTETAVLESLEKPVGVLASATQLFVADQDLGQIVVADRATPGALTVLATVAGPDLVAFGPDGSLFTGGTDGAVRQIASDGTVTTVADGFLTVRGVAWDAANRRLFVAEHDPDETDGVSHALHIVPID